MQTMQTGLVEVVQVRSVSQASRATRAISGRAGKSEYRIRGAAGTRVSKSVICASGTEARSLGPPVHAKRCR